MNSGAYFPSLNMLSSFAVPTFTSSNSSDDLFREDLQYDLPTMTANLNNGAMGTAQKNGNISQAMWQVKGRSPMAYSYSYDYLDRLTDAKFSDYSVSNTLASNNYFNETPTYDARGNILTMQRKGMVKGTSSFTNTMIDNLTYTYQGGTNRITLMADAGTDEGFKKSPLNAYYGYDNNGNMTFDPNKNLTITYNHLNLPYEKVKIRKLCHPDD